MNNTAQDNGINLSYPQFDDGSTPQPNSQPQQQNTQPSDNNIVGSNYGDFSGKVNTLPEGAVYDGLVDIIPEPRKPKAMQRTPKMNNLAEPISSSTKTANDDNDYLKPPIQEIVIEQNSVNEDQRTATPPVSTVPTPQTPVNQSTIPIEEKNVSLNGETSKITELLEYTIEKGASDLHLSVGYPPIIRVDGELQELSDDIIDPIESEELILPLMSDDKKELLEVNKEIDFAYTHQGKYNGRFRINAFYAMRNLCAAFRLIPGRIRTIEELKLPQIYHQFTKLKQGMILVTGPTGHGKSTTIAAMIEDINRNSFSRIITIEDPVEYVFEGKKSLIDQREMGQDTHSWPIALKSAMREDPDIILVGEMRDYETISSAITLAETGHLVFATLHTNNAAQSIDRMIDVFPEEQQTQIRAQLSNILETVVAQRLIPLDMGGRRAVAEILIVNPAVKTLIRESKTHQIDNVIRTSSDIGMISLERSLVDLVREGVISIKTAQEYAVYPEEVSRLLKS
jgi:twitching motility protein PilT